MTSLPVLGITIGDPGGIGSEVIFKALKGHLDLPFIPLILGSESVLTHPEIQSLCQDLPLQSYESSMPLQKGVIYHADVYDLPVFTIGSPSVENGRAAVAYLKAAYGFIQSGVIQAMVTGPICKETFLLAGLKVTGHTTFLAELSGVSEVSMAFYTPKLKTLLATVHIPFSQVPEALTETCLRRAFKHSVLFCQSLGIASPRIAVAGLNPHASENGMFGSDEARIRPIIDAFNPQVGEISGLYAPDTLYYRAYHGEFDCVVSLYHDQGLIPVKLIAFDTAVNVTVGLPFIRTSPDHGTAFDIAYQNKARPDSMMAAMDLAAQLAVRV